MQTIEKAILERAHNLISDKLVGKVLGWKKGTFAYDNEPAVLSEKELDDKFAYNSFCGANLSKYLLNYQREHQNDEEKTPILALLKPCDTYSFNQLVKEHHIDRDSVYVMGIPCYGMLDMEKLLRRGITGILDIEEDNDNLKVKTLYGEETVPKEELMLAKCRACKTKKHVVFDEILEGDRPMEENDHDRFGTVKKIEEATADERFDFWRAELSTCIRCNACRNVCPACTCVKCVFDNDDSGFASKSNADSFTENMFHIIRAYHVAGRCTDCGECVRVCPQGIPLQLLNRKFIKDINENYGEYQAGEDDNSPWPLVEYTLEDGEPGEKLQGGEGK